jgi:uncharacterized protein YggE
MNRSVARALLPLFAVCAASAAVALGQSPTGPCISGSGTATLKKDAQLMRLQIDLLAKGKDLKEALAKLKDRREAAAKKLTELGAAADSIRFEEVRVVPNKTDEQRRMEMMVRSRMRGQKTTAKEAAGKEPVKVSVTLKAEWPIKSGSIEERLMAAQELQDKVREADVAGLKEIEQLTPEEKEAAEEAEGEDMPRYMGGEEGAKPGEPLFLYVAKVSDEERTKLLADAFNKAKANAVRLARAAGTEPGPLRYLMSTGSSYMDYEGYAGYGSQYRQYFYPLMQRAQMEQGEDEAEAIGVQPGQVSMRVNVQAAFAIK